MLAGTNEEEWMRIMTAFETLGREADAAMHGDAGQMTRLLAERDALLKELTSLLGQGPAPAGLENALASASHSTAALITKAAERTDAIRRELREVGRGVRAYSAYAPSPSAAGLLNARR
jgi:hypothetical protein